MTLPINSFGVVQTGGTIQPAALTTGLRNVSIVTRVRNRKHHLIQTLPTWLSLPVKEIVIVDWSSNDGDLRDYLRYINDSRIKVVRVEGKTMFDRSAAWNTGINFASAEWVMLLDADIAVVGNPFDDPMFSDPDCEKMFFRYYASTTSPHLFGGGIFLKDHWQEMGGFHEGFSDWGWEDVKLFDDLTKKYAVHTVSMTYFRALAHESYERVMAHAEKDLRVSAAKNAYKALRTTSLKLHVRDLAETITGDGRTKQTRYWQEAVYQEPERMNAVLNSPDFMTLVRKFVDLFITPTSVKKLFTMPEFTELERRIAKELKAKGKKKKPKKKPKRRKRRVS